MTYQETLAYIHNINWCFCKPGLERTRTLCEKLGIDSMGVFFTNDQERHTSLMWDMVMDLHNAGVEIEVQQTDDNSIPKDEEMRFSQLEEMWQERCNNWGFTIC